MVIYINPFWAGFTSGAIAAAALFLGLILYIGIKGNKQKGS